MTPFVHALAVVAVSVAGLLLAGGSRDAAAAPVVIAAAIPCDEVVDVQDKVHTECTELNARHATFVQALARAKGVEAVGDPATDSGRVLRMTITNAISQGNAFPGHAKASSSRGELHEDGRRVTSARATCNSMGGMVAGHMGSCSMLGRTVRAMGEDIDAWLANPVDGAQLGDR